MRDTRIILVEGMPGTGKSTTAQFIDRTLRAVGRDSYWCHEEHAAHPVRLLYDNARHCSWSDYVEEASFRWQNFVRKSHDRNQIAVLDAAVLQNHVRSMLLFDCEWKPIWDLIHRIADEIASLRPTWIYLKPDDIEQNFRDVAQVRGTHLLDLWVASHSRFPFARGMQASSYDRFITFWKTFDSISDRVFEELTIAKRKWIIPSEWNVLDNEILDMLELLPRSDFSHTTETELERFVGVYVPQSARIVSRFRLQLQGKCLKICSDEATFDVSRGPIDCYRESWLIPTSKNRFSVAAWPHEVEFIEDETGTVVGLRLSVAQDGWLNVNDIYQRELHSI